MKKKRKKVHETSPSSLKERSTCDLLHNSRIGIYKKNSSVGSLSLYFRRKYCLSSTKESKDHGHIFPGGYDDLGDPPPPI